MLIHGKSTRSIWREEETGRVRIIDQTRLPHDIEIKTLEDAAAAIEAIKVMRVRGAPLIGATAAHGLVLALESNPGDAALEDTAARIKAARPTAINLAWAVDRVVSCVAELAPERRAARALEEAVAICDEDVASCEMIGNHGYEILEKIASAKAMGKEERGPVNLLTHCNAGWLATVDWGTALAPINCTRSSSPA